MNEFDRLRDDLQADPGVPFGPPDLAAVMTAGRRIRRRQHLAAGSAAGVVLAIIAGVAVLAGGSATTPVQPAGPAPAPPSATARPTGLPPTPEPGSASPTPGRPGVVARTVPTGVSVTGGELVLQVLPHHSAETPEIRFSVMAAVRDAAGRVDDLVAANETYGSDVAPGFHAVHAPMTVAGADVPEFGYYAGPAAKITGRTVGGTTVEASLAQARVADDPIVLFWFDPAVAGPGLVSGLTAFGADGTLLPGGDRTIGNG